MNKTKPYFTKYIQVEGEIKEGDVNYNPSAGEYGIFMPSGKSIYNPNSDGCYKVKLFLCSRDIQIDDQVVPLGNTKKWKILDIYTDNQQRLIATIKESSLKQYWECFVDNLTKPIGEISPEALGYVKEGDEFDEDKIKHKYKQVKAGFETYFDTEHQEERERDVFETIIEYYLIKGSCGHFH